MGSVQAEGSRDGGGPTSWLGTARVAALLALVSVAGAVALVAIGVQGLTDRPDQRPPFAWITTLSCASAVVSLAVATLVLRLRRAGLSAMRLSWRVCVAAATALVANFLVFYLIIAFVYGED